MYKWTYIKLHSSLRRVSGIVRCKSKLAINKGKSMLHYVVCVNCPDCTETVFRISSFYDKLIIVKGGVME